MPESEAPASPNENPDVELIVVRGTVVAGKTVKRGDKITVPKFNKKAGVYPERWWLNNKKAARNKAEFEAFCDAVGPTGFDVSGRAAAEK